MKWLKVLRILLEMLMSVDEDFESRGSMMASLYLTLHTKSVELPDQGPVSLTVRDCSQNMILRDDIPHHTSQLSPVHRL